MQKAVLTTLCVLSLILFATGCSMIPIYKPEVQQGNVLTPAMIHRLKVGMTKQEVAAVIGTPVLADTFRDNRWDYVYTIKPSWSRYQAQRMTLYFKNGRLVSFGP